ncbi:hypothetical protein ACKVWM_011496 [Pyricularia oryzae]
MGCDTPDANLANVFLLSSKRIGHEFELTRHPYLVEQFKRRDIYLGVCPISNEVLGLTPWVNGLG